MDAMEAQNLPAPAAPPAPPAPPAEAEVPVAPVVPARRGSVRTASTFATRTREEQCKRPISSNNNKTDVKRAKPLSPLSNHNKK